MLQFLELYHFSISAVQTFLISLNKKIATTTVKRIRELIDKQSLNRRVAVWMGFRTIFCCNTMPRNSSQPNLEQIQHLTENRRLLIAALRCIYATGCTVTRASLDLRGTFDSISFCSPDEALPLKSLRVRWKSNSRAIRWRNNPLLSLRAFIRKYFLDSKRQKQEINYRGGKLLCNN